MASVKRLFIEIGLKVSTAPLKILQNSLNLVRSSLVATFRTAVVGGFFAAMRAGFQTINDIGQSVSRLTGEMAELQLAAIRTAAVVSEGGSGFSAAFEQASSMARSLSTEVNFTAGQIQEGLFTAAQAGYDLNQALGFTKSALMLASTSGEDFKEIMNDMIGLSRAFGIGFSQLPQMADAIAGAAQKSKVSVQGLFEGLKNVASVANVTFGESIDTFTDMTAALMTLNDAGIENSTAGVKMRAALQQLNSGTAKTTAVFSKYGINIFKADSANQVYLDTLLKSQKAFEGYDEELNKLKNSQFDMVLAGKQGTDEYDQLEKKISAVTDTLQTLEQGMNAVDQQFKLAGGQLKPFHEVLTELQKAPKEAIGRAFGIRGGESILRLLQNSKNFGENRREVQRFMEESQRGTSILQNVYEKFFSSILIRWQVMKNDVIAIFSVIADAAFQAFGPLFDPIEMGIKSLFQNIEANKDIFKKLFEGVANLLKPIVAQVGIIFAMVGEKIKDIFAEGKSVTLPVASFNQKTGKIETEDKTVGGTAADKLAFAAHVFISALSAGFQAVMEKLKPFFQVLGSIFAEALTAVLQAKIAIFMQLGASVALGFFEAMKKMLPILVVALKDALVTQIPQLGKMLGKPSGVRPEVAAAQQMVNNGMNPKEAAQAVAMMNPTQVLKSLGQNTSIDEAIKSGAATLPKPETTTTSAGTGFIEMNGKAYDIDMNKLNATAVGTKMVGGQIVEAIDRTNDAFIEVSKATLEARRQAESMNRSQYIKDLKVK